MIFACAAEILPLLSQAQFGERRYGQLKNQLANRLYVTSAPVLVTVLAETAFDGLGLRQASTGAAPAFA